MFRFRVLGFREDLRFRVSGLQALGFRVLGFMGFGGNGDIRMSGQVEPFPLLGLVLFL